MDLSRFNEALAVLTKECDAVLLDRKEAYAADEDRLENFKLVAAITKLTPLQVCNVLQMKHVVALGKAVKERNHSRMMEYIVDIINYQRLGYALLQEAIPQENTMEGYIHTIKRPA